MNLSISSGVSQGLNVQSISSLNRFTSKNYNPLASPTVERQSNLYNDYSNHYIHTGEKPVKFIRNVDNLLTGYPRLQKLIDSKKQTISTFKTKPYGLRLDIDAMVPYLNRMILANLKFDVIIIGSLSETQFIVPLLINLPLSKLCSKPGFLFIWASASQIKELSNILNNQKFSNWNNFRKSEELIFIPVDNTTTRSDNDGLLDNNQWHCWMCITGTVRRSVDNHLIHCNIDTDLKIESEEEAFNSKTSTPEFIYKIAENFSSGNRRLHIIPSRSGSSKYIKPREGWCVISPDIILDNFTIEGYQSDISRLGLNVKYGDEIEKIRPKSPKRYNNNQNNHR